MEPAPCFGRVSAATLWRRSFGAPAEAPCARVRMCRAIQTHRGERTKHGPVSQQSAPFLGAQIYEILLGTPGIRILGFEP